VPVATRGRHRRHGHRPGLGLRCRLGGIVSAGRPLLGRRWRAGRLQPFGRGTIIACALCLASFGAVPLALRYLLGSGLGAIAFAMLAGGALLAVGLWRFRDVLELSVMPGLSALARRFRPG